MLSPSTDLERPAVAGGAPVRERLLPYGHQSVGVEEEQALLRVVRSAYLTQGPETMRFELRLSGLCGARQIVAFSSGTTALHACLAALGLGPNDEVIVPAMTFIATCNAVIYTGARPVIADVAPDTLTLSPQALERAITPATRAVVVVHYAGHPCDMPAILEIAAKHRLAVVEDAAHALGSTWCKDKTWTTVGSSTETLAAFSFHPVKTITTAEGGAVATACGLMEHRLRVFRHHGIDRGSNGGSAQDYRIHTLGINGRMSELQAALGLVQLDRLGDFLIRRRAIAERYLTQLAELDALILPVEKPDATSSWHLFPVRLRPEVLRVSRREVVAALHQEGVGAQVHYVPLHLHPHVQKNARVPAAGLRVAEAAYQALLSLPLWPGMSDRDADDVLEAVHRVIAFFRR